ncbi:MAG: dihydrodipicolinate synthase family protein [Acidobacteriaceae bacterium]|nr:dihydrodipicolinate synthase family protein [Acidobacteriaceae bacterium]
MKLQGIFPALTTCFDESGEIHKEKLAVNIRKLNQIALAGYTVCGSTGESPLMSFNEKLDVLSCVAGLASNGKTLIAGVGQESVRETVRLVNMASEIGYHVGLALTPYYYKSQAQCPDTQKLYFRAIADESKLPILIYNMPRVTGYDVPVDVVAELSHHPNIIGMKDSSGNVEKLKETAGAVKAGFQILSGSGMTFCDALYAGAVGAILAIANAVPYACVTVWEAFRMRQEEAARDWQQRLLSGAKLVPGVHGIPGLKHLMDIKGYYGGRPRLPLMPSPPEARAEIERAFDGINS